MAQEKEGLRASLGRAPSVLRERFSFPLSCLGIGLISTYTELSYVHPPIEYAGASASTPLLFDASTIVVSIILAIIVRLRMVSAPLASRGGVLILAAVLLIGSTCVNFGVTAAGLVVPWLVSTMAVAAGAGLALLFVMWFEVVSRLNPAQLVLCYAAGAAGRVCLIWLFSALPLDRLWVCMCAICLLAIFTLRCSWNRGEGSGSAEIDGAICGFPSKPLLVITVGSVANVFIMNSVGNPGGVNGSPGVMLAALVVVVLVLCRGDYFQFKRLWQFALAFIVVASAVSLFGGPLLQASGILAAASYEMCLMIMYSILGNLVFRYSYNATFLYAVELAIALIAAHIGQFVCELINETMPWGDSLVLLGISVCFAIAFVLVVSWAFSSQNLEDRWGTVIKTPIAEDFDLALEKTHLGMRCHELAKAGDLSRREEEVLLLLLRKEKPAKIAEDLCIGVSTVNTHKKHIYQKLDVHSNKQLIALASGESKT